MTIYVGNLSHQATEQDLNQLFSEFGTVNSINMPKDRVTGQLRGFAFVEMSESEAATKAISKLNETDFMQRVITVNEARPKTNSGRGGGDSYRPKKDFNSIY
ncbi:MAG TPA: hypothetical protein VNE41_00895 [Chitinophagaceae bacterium]|nr:hypothetical protein [Chitinophagaceae bacterium]